MIIRKLILIAFVLSAFAPTTANIAINRGQDKLTEVQVDGLEALKLRHHELKAVEEKITAIEEETYQIAQRVDDPNELQKIRIKLKEKK